MNATSETKTATSRGADQEFEHLNKSSNEQIATLIRPALFNAKGELGC